MKLAIKKQNTSFLRRVSDLNSVEGALLRYQIMAIIVGIGLATLVFVGVPLKYGFNFPYIANIVGTIHGIMYMLYLVSGTQLWIKVRFSFSKVILIIASGFLPLTAFIMERNITRTVNSLLLERDCETKTT